MYRAIFISDIHLGSPFNKNKQIFELLEHIEAEKIFLIGDIINTPAPNDHPNIIKFITLLHSKAWEIVYISGNHEDDRKLPPISMDLNNRLFSKEKDIYRSNHHNICLEHGHSFHHNRKFDTIIKAFTLSFRSISFHKNRDKKHTKIKKSPKRKDFYYRVLKPLAQRLLIRSFRSYMISLAEKNSCDVVICGHFHMPEDKTIRGIRYLNCGDWINNNSFVVEDMYGNLFLKTL
jgi:UDP-2,3-diacylglucosamine pyrophosphatase LpxH